MKKKTAAPDETLVAYKGFDADWSCRGFKYELGQTYTFDGDPRLCAAGFHACEYPLDVFNYYPPNGKLATVALGGVTAEKDDDSKRVGKTITIKAALDIVGLVKAAIEYTTNRCEPSNEKHATGDQSASSATGNRSASSATGNRSASSATGYQSASSATGNRSASSATGNRSASSATGDQSASSATGDQSASSATGNRSASSATGNRSASSATGYQSASSATGNRSASSATGNQSASSATGNRSASSATGDQSASSATGYQAIAAAFGLGSTAKAGETGIVIVAWWDGKRKRLTTGYVGENGVEADIVYRCDNAGMLVKA